MRSTIRTAMILGLPVAMAFSGQAEAQTKFSVAPYIWGAGLQGTVGARGLTAPVDIGFGDILDNTDFAAIVHAEATGDRVGFLFDLVYLNLGVAGDIAELDSRFYLMEFAATGLLSRNVEGLIGVRYLNVQDTLGFSGPFGFEAEPAQGWVDPFVGLRTTGSLGDRWSLTVRGDVGGFGISSDLAWQMVGTLSYELSPSVDLGLGYRHLDINYKTGEGAERFVWDMAMSGPFFGARFNF